MNDDLVCAHFSLARSCLVCELEAELAEARRTIDTLYIAAQLTMTLEDRREQLAEIRARWGVGTAIYAARKETP